MALVKRAAVGAACFIFCVVAITASGADDLCLSPVMQIPFGAAKPVVSSPDGSLLYYSHGYAYVGASDLHIIDVSQAPAFADVAKIDWFVSGSGAYEVAVADGFAFVGDGTGTLGVADVSDPEAPVVVGQIVLPGEILDDIALSGHYIYVANRYNGLRIVDVSDPTTPRPTGSLNSTWEAYSVTIQDGLAYVGAGRDGAMIIDVSDPTLPVEVAGPRISAGPGSVSVGGGYVFVATGASVDVFRDCTSWVFVDGFESGDTSNWTVAAP